MPEHCARISGRAAISVSHANRCSAALNVFAFGYALEIADLSAKTGANLDWMSARMSTELCTALLEEEKKRCALGRSDHDIPLRPDYGHALLSDLQRPSQPEYSLIGRMRGLAELRGVMLGCS
jgi:hypothetical protein